MRTDEVEQATIDSNWCWSTTLRSETVEKASEIVHRTSQFVEKCISHSVGAVLVVEGSISSLDMSI